MKILSKLTLKNLKLNKSRTVVTIIGIMLSTALIMVVAGMMTSLQQTMLDEQINYSGDFEISVEGTNKEFIEKTSANRDIEEVYVQSSMGCALVPEVKNEYRPYINVTGLSKNCFEDGFNIILEEGRFPENENEIIMTQDALMNYGGNLKVGDTITLDLGTRVASNGEILSDYDDYASLLYNEYDDNGNLVTSVTESLENTHKKTYTITGVIKYCNSSYIVAESWTASSTAITALDDYSDGTSLNAYINIKPESEKEYLKVTQQVTGLSEKASKSLWGVDEDSYEEADYLAVVEEMNDNENFSTIGTNSFLMEYKGYGVSDSTLNFLYTSVMIVVAVIVFASVFVIRNSFAISITEKTKLYGMLISTGATPKQVKKNVLFEGVILGVIAVSLGLILGIGVIALLIWLLNVLLSDYLYGLSIAYSLPWWLPFFTIAMSAIVIFFSTYSAAVRASRIAPVVAIRENNFVKLSKKQKHYKSPKLIKKLFGVGGDIAYKNLKRSKKKYRTTVVSIIASVTIFIFISTFVDYGMIFSSKYFSEMDYNFQIFSCTDEQADVITSFDGINKVAKSKRNYNTGVIGINDYSSDVKKYYEFYEDIKDIDLSENCYVATFIFDDDYFKEFAQAHGFDYNEVKDEALVYNDFPYVDENGVNKNGRYYDIEKGSSLELTFNRVYYDTDLDVEVPTGSVVVGGEILELQENYYNTFSYYGGTIIVSESWYSKNVGENTSTFDNLILLDCEDPAAVGKAIQELGYYDVDYMNNEEIVEQNNTIVLIMSIFCIRLYYCNFAYRCYKHFQYHYNKYEAEKKGICNFAFCWYDR